MTIRDWEESVKDTSTEGLLQIREALKTLQNWTPFSKAFAGYGIETIRTMVSLEIQDRTTN